MLTDDDIAAEFARAVDEQSERKSPAGLDAARIFRRGRRQRHRRIATGVASVAAVAGLVTGLVVTGAGPSAPTSSAHGQLPGNTLLDARIVPALTAAAADAGMPRYYIVASAPTLAPLEVRSSATGKMVSTVSPPAACDPKSLRLAAAGNNRDFVFSCATSPRSNSFYRFQISAAGHASALTPLSIPDSGGLIYDMALSPDGSKLAMPGAGGIEVVTLATGAVRTWTVPATGTLFNVTWSGDGREVGTWAFSGLYVVNVSEARSSPHPARLVLPRTVGSDDVNNAILSPAGTIIASVNYHSVYRDLSLNQNSVVGGIVEISATTGRPLRTLLAQHATYYGPGSHNGYAITSCALGAIDATGHHLLVMCNQFGRLDRGRFTPMPGPGMATGALYTSAW
jgi:hypothetical protein